MARETLTAEQWSTTVPVTVNLRDINDNSPKFAQREYTAHINENRDAGYYINTITVSMSDMKFGAMREHKYLSSCMCELIAVSRDLYSELIAVPCDLYRQQMQTVEPLVS